MNVVGIIAEFNPFHQGHAYMIQKAKEITCSDLAVIIMNGEFVQRGEPAVFSKYDRTKAALEGGADLILELPVRFGISSAGDFALGGVLALSALGFVTHLAFGSECGDILPFQDAAAALFEESEEFHQTLAHLLREGMSFPAARSHALTETSPIPPSLLKKPNNILGVEYCLALKKTNSPLIPVTIPRTGMGYHETFANEYDQGKKDKPSHRPEGLLSGKAPQMNVPSATALRQKIYDSDTPHLALEDFDSALGYALLQDSNLTRYKDISSDLADRVQHCIPDYRTIRELTGQCQTRAFTDGRIRRGLMQCLLHIEATDHTMPYLRLLGLRINNKNTGASSLLSQVPDSCHILSRLAMDIKILDPHALALFRQDLFAADLYRQTWCRKYNISLPNEYQHSPIIVG